jgi:hypothetical protein
MFMHHIGRGVGHNIINLIVQDPRVEDSDLNMDDGQSTAAGMEDEDNIDYEDNPDELEDSEDDFDYDEENGGDLEDDGNNELRLEDGDFNDYKYGFIDF